MKRCNCLGVWLGLFALCAGGCTPESTRIALEAQRRADQVEEAVFSRQHESLRILLYRDLLRRLAAAGPELTEAQQAAADAVWNERDLVEFWAVQHERARALRIAGVDAKLAADQSIVDLLLRQVEARAERLEQGLAAAKGASVAAAASQQAEGLPGPQASEVHDDQ